MMNYILTGGQLIIDKQAFGKEILLPHNSLKQLIGLGDNCANKPPIISKNENVVIIEYGNSCEIELDANFYDIFKNLKIKYRDKIRGRVVIRITSLSSYYVNLDLNTEDEKVIYE